MTPPSQDKRIVQRDRDGVLYGRWWIEIPTDGGIDLECGPFWTRAGARLHRWLWG